MRQKKSDKQSGNWLKLVMVMVVAVGVYFAYQQLQRHLGQQARDNIRIEMLDFDVALAKAQAHEKLILADMSAIWCPTCRKLDSTIFSDERVQQVIDNNFVFARIDYDTEQGQDFAQSYRVSGYPVLLILDEQGEKLTRLPLSFDPMEFIGNLNKVLSTQQKALAN